MLKLRYAVQQYAWGNIGEESEVWCLLEASGNNSRDKNGPFAELWLGTHVSGPSIIESSNKKLVDHIIDHPQILGASTISKFGVNLPFLLKVLSVKTALSIQVHPNKKEAEFLHRVAPDIYKDNNHKPELAIALTNFEALVGFRSLTEITFFIQSIPQIGDLIGDVKKGYLDLINEEQKFAAFKICYKTLMKSEPSQIVKAISSLVADFQSGKIEQYLSEKYAHLAHLFLKLNSQYPNDIGCFSVFLLNYVILEPGEAVFLSANVPHAYIEGNIIECMASSDNVVRAGLTPKLKDIETLVSMLNYESMTVDKLKFKPTRLPSSHISITRDLFSPPVEDFAVERIKTENMVNMYELGEMYQTASIIIVIEGDGLIHQQSDGKVVNKIKYKRGEAYFVPANSLLTIKSDSSSTLFRAFINSEN